ncbi:MAG: hypothetical protein AAB176_05455 [Pseudomonadota bacterium]
MNPITITIESKPTTINFDGRELQVQKLSIPLPFGRKPSDISEIAAVGADAVYVTDIREMEPEEFDGFTMNLHKSRDWLKGKGGYYGDGRLCVAVHAPGRPYLFIDPSGGDNVRYLARLG